MKMKNLVKFTGTLLLSLSMALIPMISVHADTVTDNNVPDSSAGQVSDELVLADTVNPRPLYYMCDNKEMDDGMGGTGPAYVYKKEGTTDKLIQDDYWTDLEKKNIATEADDFGESVQLFGVFPKYLPLPSETKVSDYCSIKSGAMLQPFPNSGICMNGYSEVGGIDIKQHKKMSEAAIKGTSVYEELPTNTGDQNNDYYNPDNWTKADLLTSDEVNDPDKNLTAYGDLFAAGEESISNKTGSYNTGDPVNLEFSLNIGWFKRYINALEGRDYFNKSAVGPDYDTALNKAMVVADAGLTFTLDIPKGIICPDSKDIKAELSGLEGFSISNISEPNDNNDGSKTLVIQVRRDNVEPQGWQALRKQRAKIDTSNIRLSVQGLKVSSDAADGSTINIRGTESGFYTFEKEGQFGGYFFFAAKQGDEGRDAALPSDGSRNNMISYSFKVSKPVTPVTPVEDHTVTFHPANGQSDFTQTVADGNKVSQPAEPVQDGYTFNGWYTDSALTNAYDFNTPVKNDMDLYAKWTKNKVTGILLPKVIASGSSKQTLTWTPLTNVDGYYVYEAYCNTYKHVHPFKKVADVSASSPRVYKRSGLKKGAAYKYYVAAYQIKNGKKQVVKKSVTVHSAAGNLLKTKNVKYTNVKSVSVKKNAVTLKVGKTYRIQPSAKGVYSGYAILQKGHAAMFRYLYIKDGKNIKVSQNGTVKALKTGKCNVYVLGTNGVRAKVAVTVK